MVKYIILWNDGREEYEADNMSEVESYANNLITEYKYWSSITKISE